MQSFSQLNIFLYFILYFIFQIHSLINEMKEIYVRARVCPYKQIDIDCNLTLDYG